MEVFPMKIQSISLFRQLKPVLVFAILVLSFLSFTTYVSAAEVQSKTETVEQVQKIVNINTASAEQLSGVLKGIGIKKAQAIVSWREKNGKFASIEQLLEVKGIGEKTLTLNKSKIKI